MITHPNTYNVALRPYYKHMTTPANTKDEAWTAAILLDVIETTSNDEQWAEMPIRTLYDVLSPFVPQHTVRSALQWLEADGLIVSRFDETNRLNRKKQYRLREDEVQKRIDCWTSENEAVKHAPLRIIQAVMREQVETFQIMQNDAVRGVEVDIAKVHAGNSNLSSIPEKQDISELVNHYESTMATIHVLLGVEVFPVVGKKPAPKTPDDPFGWEWSKKRLNMPGRHLATVHAWKVATGYGMIPVKGDRLVFIDIDRSEFEAELFELLPRLKTTYRQQRGTHSCLAIRLPLTLENRFEINDEAGEIASIRNHNSYQVGAGSLHPEGERYVATNMVEPIDLTADETTALLGLFEARKPKPSRPSHPTLTLVKSSDPLTVDSGHKTWARKGQEQALRELSAAVHGNFNTTLYKTACRLANLAKVTGESPEQLHDLLWEVCEQAGYVRRDGQSQTWATIRNGIRAGEAMPLSLPERKTRLGGR